MSKHLLLYFFLMSFDTLYSGRESVINLTEVSTSAALAKASTCERIAITLDHIGDDTVMVLPIRIVEGMGEIANRGTVTKKQATLIGALVALMGESPLLRAM